MYCTHALTHAQGWPVAQTVQACLEVKAVVVARATVCVVSARAAAILYAGARACGYNRQRQSSDYNYNYYNYTHNIYRHAGSQRSRAGGSAETHNSLPPSLGAGEIPRDAEAPVPRRYGDFGGDPSYRCDRYCLPWHRGPLARGRKFPWLPRDCRSRSTADGPMYMQFGP